MAKFAFKKGWDQVPNGKMAEVKEKLMAAIGITGNATFYARMKGIPEATISEYTAITGVVQEMGITDIWGE